MKGRVTPKTIVVAAREQVSCDLDGEAAILNLKSGVYYGLDPVGARVWSLIQKPRTVDSIRDVLVEEYDVEPARCLSDLLALLTELAEEGLLDVKNETA